MCQKIFKKIGKISFMRKVKCPLKMTPGERGWGMMPTSVFTLEDKRPLLPLDRKWVDPRIGMDAVEAINMFVSVGKRFPIPRLLSHSPSLY
jgi:hypothetical protein